MKKITLLVASILLYGNIANASELINYPDERTRTDFSINDPIEFTERGITFYVFLNGEFDFNTVQSVGNDNYYRRGMNTTNGAPGVRTTYAPTNGGVVIEHDALGRVRRIGNVFVNYDYDNRIKRIGTIYMSYNHFALDQIGGLKIIYNRNGQIVNTIGSVKRYRGNYSCDSPYDTDYRYNNSYPETQSNTSNQYYYRKAKTNNEDKKE